MGVVVDVDDGDLHDVDGVGGEHGGSDGHHLVCPGVSMSQELCEHSDLQSNKSKLIIKCQKCSKSNILLNKITLKLTPVPKSVDVIQDIQESIMIGVTTDSSTCSPVKC